MSPLIDTLALEGSPAGWAAVVVLALIIVSPKLLPAVARLVGRYMELEVRRRLGIREPSRPRQQTRPASVEVMPPEPSRYEVREAVSTEVIEATPVAPRRRKGPLWLVAGGVRALVILLTWL